MKRWITRILICLLLGAVINVAVAWGFAWYHQTHTSWISTPDQYAQVAGSETVLMWCSRLGVNRLSSSFIIEILYGLRESDKTIQVPSDVEQMLIAEVTDSDGQSIEGLPETTITAFGWPATSLLMREYQVIQIQDWNVIPLQKRHHFRDCVAYHSERNGSVSDHLRFPIRPLWLPFILNVVLYSLNLYCFVFAPRQIRRLLRHCRGHCPQCSYELHGEFSAGCPECGWRRDTGLRAVTSDSV